MDGRSEGAVRTLQRRRLERGLAREQEEAGEGEARSSAASAHADMVARPSKRSLCGHWWEVGFRPLFGLRRFCWSETGTELIFFIWSVARLWVRRNTSASFPSPPSEALHLVWLRCTCSTRRRAVSVRDCS
jgi:hypothetical protein